VERRVSFAGPATGQRLAAFYHTCRFLVLPSTHRSESFGIVQLEAMACGKPVICTELGTGTSFVTVNGETGLVVPPRDANALASAMNLLLGEESLCEQYGEAARKRVHELFTHEMMVDRLIRIYSSLQNRKE
jgi:glycosyltransferase involved in cell wall biosynthesis